ncbi:metallophosphoesterase family protein [Deinococcus soli (ex Cha et al. 2016)]|uniref:Metallophosphoesterase n=1 Tax=Deinococcus soli (ex Cha et al. 2016) TaxID=1309411 RepID=A0A0F7JIC3_9DEIO|nr:metallophosphoesterase family protein [Deinococcus soli (ex Cha et al. 2016)]AKH15701.1 metallophosphoesterase [Deinococcus soli (ex Cha et al. 2016)]
MRLAILGDVHGNAFALRAVLDDIRAASPDQVLNLGDTVWGCADPASAWALQQECAPPSVRGNTDERVAGLRDGKETMRAWVRARLPADVPATLAALPTHLDTADGEVRVAHGSPRSPWEDLMLTGTPDGHTRPARFRELRERLGGFRFGAGGRVCIVGHTHREMLTVVDGLTVVNAGPVSRQKDGLPLARWVQLTRRAGHWTAEFRRVPYDTQAASTWARTHGPAGAGDHEAHWLTTGREP